MNISEIEKQLPNGFHDSLVKKIDIDYISKTVKITFDIFIEAGFLRTGILHLTGLSFISIDSPETGYPYLDDKGLWISGCGNLTNELRKKIPMDLREDAFSYYFFINEWNAFIVFAATNAYLKWIE